VHDYTNQFNIKWNNKSIWRQKSGIKEATVLVHVAQKVGEQLSALLNRLRRQCVTL